MCDIYYAYDILPKTKRTWWTSCVAGKKSTRADIQVN